MRRRKEKPRSPWFQGLLDAEAKCLIEPCDWDHEYPPGYWFAYAAGAADYREHAKRVKELGE